MSYKINVCKIVMNRCLLFSMLFFVWAVYSVATNIEPVSPIRFRQESGFQILSYVKLDRPINGKLKGYINGKDCEIINTNRSDSVLVWLPMIGNHLMFKIKEGGECLVNQTIMPYIPSDWGYFKNGTIHIIQSSHQDIAWMDTPDYCKEDRINNIILPALNMMKKNPSFKFEMEQTLNLMEFLEKHPERKEEIAQLYKEKRFGWGATYNQPYEGLSSGEQLIHQVYYGRKWIKENFPGADDVVANNIDVPGRTWQMPQILAKSGIPNLFISRMGEGLYDWYAPDGSKVLTFTPGNYGWASMIWKFFDKDAAAAMHKLHHRTQIWGDYFKQYNIPPHYAILMSCDATKPVDFQHLINDWNRIVEASGVDMPRLKASTAEEYFEAVRGENTSFRKIKGERPDLWLYIHGPAHYEATCYKREAAVVIPAAEAFTTFAMWKDNELINYPRKYMDRAWMASIYPDHGLGGKNGDITDRIFKDSLKIGRDLGQTALNSALQDILTDINTKKGNYVVFNGLTRERSKLVSVEIKSDCATVVDEIGKKVRSQVVTVGDKNHLVFRAENVPSMGFRSYTINNSKRSRDLSGQVYFNNNTFENKYYKAVLGDGGIVSLYDKQLGKEITHTSKFACGDVIELGYTGNGAGEFTRITDVTPGDITPLSSMKTIWKVSESGNLFTRFVNEQNTKHAIIVQTITFHHMDKKIDFDVTLKDFDGEHNRQYRIAFPVNMMSTSNVHYEVPMGVAQVGKDELNIQPGGWAWGGTYIHHPKDTHPREIMNFISVSGNDMGVTMSSCVAVADWIDPSREIAPYPILQGILLSSHKSCHGEGNWYSQKGTHHFHFSLTSHEEGWKNGYNFGTEENYPFYVVKKNNEPGLIPANYSFLGVSDPFVGLSIIKKADNDNAIILRLVEMEGKDKMVKITLPKSIKGVVRTNLIEEEEEDLNIYGKTLQLKMGHHSIETFKLLLK